MTRTLSRAPRTALLAVLLAACGTSDPTEPVAAPPVIFFDMVVAGNRDIYRVALDGSDLMRVTTNPAEDLAPTAAGSRVVFTSYRDGNGELYSVTLPDTVATRLTHTTAHETQPALSPDGLRLAFVSDESGAPKVFVADSDGSAAVRLAPAFGFGGHIESSPSWSPSASHVAFSATPLSASDIFTVAIGSAPAALSGASAARIEVEPAWSPDGTRMAFAAVVGSATEIFVVPAGGGVAQQLTNEGLQNGQPAWLRDGRLVFTRFSTTGSRLFWMDISVPAQIHEIPIEGGSPQRAAPAER